MKHFHSKLLSQYKKIVLTLPILFLGCMVGYNYVETFNESVSKQQSEVHLTQVPFVQLREAFVAEASNLGYEEVLYQSDDRSFIVLGRSPAIDPGLLSGNSKSHKLMVKFTKWKNNQTRMDLVNAGSNYAAQQDVGEDIQILKHNLSASG